MHQVVEYSANIEAQLDIQELVNVLHQAAADCGVFPLAGIRTRAERRDCYRIADGHPDNAFINVYARIGPRPSSERKQAQDFIFDRLQAFLAPIYESTPLAVSMEMTELPEDREKTGNIRKYLAQRGVQS
ncbi:MAG: 5-carboxymethyl-2-hydroxymuconate isomerase [Pseudomonadota bacterium]